MAVPYFRLGSRAIQGTISTRFGSARRQFGASWSLNWRVAAKDLDPRAAREITNALRQFQSAVEKVALEQQVNELKAQLKELKKRCVA